MPADGLAFLISEIKDTPLFFLIASLKLRNNFGIFLFESGHQNEALNIYKQFDDQGIHFIDSYINYSNILIKINNYTKALSILDKLLLLDQKNSNK